MTRALGFHGFGELRPRPISLSHILSLTFSLSLAEGRVHRVQGAGLIMPWWGEVLEGIAEGCDKLHHTVDCVPFTTLTCLYFGGKALREVKHAPD
jgi:hypothetical protein